MTGKEQEPVQDQQTQKTPKGLEIPLPKRDSIFDALRKVIKPAKKP